MGERTWATVKAAPAPKPLLIGLYGPSGGGKTYSALRLATGIRRVIGGDIHGIDTESGRMLHYVDDFEYEYTPFAAPFGSLDYLGAIQNCISRGAKVLVIDSMSHEHEGPGGVLERHEAYVKEKGHKESMTGWRVAKEPRRKLIQALLQLQQVAIIFCFRAKEKLKIEPGKNPVKLGWMPIAGDDFIYEMTLNALLLPNADGVPTWRGAEEGEHAILKCPARFRGLFARKVPFCEEHGESLARWASGAPYPFGKLDAELLRATTPDELEAVSARAGAARKSRELNAAEFQALKDLFVVRKNELGKPADPEAA